MKSLTICCLVLCFIGLGEASGGGRTSGGSYSSGGSRSYSSSSGSRYSSTYYNSGSSYGGGGGGGEAMPMWAIMLCIGGGVFLLLLMCCSMHSSKECGEKGSTTMSSGGGGGPRIYYEGSIPCYLCLSRIKNSEWDTDHRKRCFYGHKEEILSYPTPQRIFCPTCGDMLRLWPKKGVPFLCNNMDRGKCILQSLPGGGGPGEEIVNTGLNRYNCFMCDYDLCKDCVEKSLRDTAASNPRTFDRVNSIKYNKYNFDPNSESAVELEHPKWELVGGAWRNSGVPSASVTPPSNQLGQSGLPYQVQPLSATRTPQPNIHSFLPTDGATSNPLSQGDLPYSVNPIQPSAPLMHGNEPSAPPSYFDAVRT